MMKLNTKVLAKFSRVKAAKVNTIDNLNNTSVTALIVHTGKVLTIDDINKNRSSKYTYLSF